MFRLITAAAVAGLALSTAAQADSWDTNNDGVIDSVEFTKGHETYKDFVRFDEDRDGYISPTELGMTEPDSVFLVIDADEDGMLSREELSEGTFVSYDTDADGVLSEAEFVIYENEQVIRTSPYNWEAINDQIEAGKVKR